jgi:hypothetical protein
MEKTVLPTGKDPDPDVFKCWIQIQSKIVRILITGGKNICKRRSYKHLREKHVCAEFFRHRSNFVVIWPKKFAKIPVIFPHHEY